MKIKIKDYFSDEIEEKELVDFIEKRMDGNDYGMGQLETVEATTRNVARAFALLIDRLAAKDIIVIDDLDAIFGTLDKISEIKR